ncbi:siderophore-interacting protein [Rouxiella badensis]|uniref:siderophore-interacting protein n=1 Tax=Rouxiella badensis TaxID=1646377 RepID=UPI001D14799D|nr:SIP domain-containing protein [Rouxiella badensis]MCC3721345.1 siderophore-interacting protein [Rouxiella badensis]MCC3731138.1 siderophore-interacting protein [Rouxiella badensis]
MIKPDESVNINNESESRRMRTSRVCGLHHIATNVKRITLCGDDVDSFLLNSRTQLPAAWIKVLFPDGLNYAARAYTLSGLDKFAGTIDFDMVLHGSGPAVRWAKNAQIGDVVGFAGPGPGGFALNPKSKWLLLIVDEAGIPAMKSILTSLPSNLPVILFVGVESSVGITQLTHSNLIAQYSAISSLKGESAMRMLVQQAIDEQVLPASEGQAWIATEADDARYLKQRLIEAEIFKPTAIFSREYWKKGVKGFNDTP